MEPAVAHLLENVFAWLEAGAAADYQAGVLLLQKHSGNRLLINQLLKKESATNREKLTYELIKVGCEGRMEDVVEVVNHFAQAVQQAVPPAEPTPDLTEQLLAAHRARVAKGFPAQPAPDQVPEAAQGEVDEITQLMGTLFNQRAQLSNTLGDVAEADAPGVVAEILALQEQYNDLAEKRRRLVAGEPVATEQPAGEPAPVVDRAELMKQVQNLRSNISKTRKKLKETKTEAKKSELTQKLGQLEVELTTLELALKA